MDGMGGFIILFVLAFVALLGLMSAKNSPDEEGVEEATDEPVMPDYKSYFVPMGAVRTLAQRIKSVKRCEYANSEIVESNFPLQNPDVGGKVKIILVQLKKKAGTEEVLRHMDEFGLRPAWIEELLALGEVYPGIQRKTLLVGLGAIWEKPDVGRLVPYLEFYGDLCSMYLHLVNKLWPEDCFFLAISK